MLDRTGDHHALVEAWLGQFERAISSGGDAALAQLFHEDSHWRDLVALTWDIVTVSGREKIIAALRQHTSVNTPSLFRIAEGRTPPRQVTRAGQRVTEAIFAFETASGRGSGVIRLFPDKTGEMKAWTFMTSLDEIKGHEEMLDRTRPAGVSYSRDFRGPNWLDNRRSEMTYADRDPAVLIVGGGQSGLCIAARLKQLNVDALIVDRMARIGDNWRKRYHALTLHNQVHVNHLPYMPFPPTWPRYIPKDKLANWFEAYVESLELNFWTSTAFEGGTYDETAQQWTVQLRQADGTSRTMRPRHIVLATGVSGIPNMPDIPTLGDFKGQVLHSSQYTDGDDWKGKRAIVIGTGNSGHDIAQDLHSSGASVTIVQRSSTMVVNIEPSAQLPYMLYDEGPSVDDCDLLVTGVPLAVGRRSHQHLTQQAKEIDKPLLDGLRAKGFKLDDGFDGTGWQFKYLMRGGGYYFNVGCSDLIASGDIGLLQNDDIEKFVADGVQTKSGAHVPADLIVLATGYRKQEDLVERLFGKGVADRVGVIWGYGEKQELRNMYTRTPQPGLWFIAGGLAQCRINSKFLGLQIKACETGLISPSVQC